MTRRLVFLLGTILLGMLVWLLGPAEILRAIGRIGWHSLPIVLLFGLFQMARAAALKLSTPPSAILRYRDALWIRFSGEAVQSLSFTGPILAEPAKAWLLERRGLSLTEGFAATITEYLVSLFVGAAMCAAGLLYLLHRAALPPLAVRAAWGVIVVSGAFLLAAAIAIATRFHLIGSIIGWLGRVGVLRGRLRPAMPAVNRMEDLLLGVLRDRPARFGAIALVELAGQVPLVLEVWWVLRVLDVVAPAAYPLVIEAATKFASLAFFFVPMQTGAAEGTYAVVFGALGLPSAAGFSLAFVRRLRSLFVAAAGLAAVNAMTREDARRTPR